MVGSGVTGAEFASVYHALRCEVVLVSSRSQVLPSKDSDAARVIQEAFETRGMTILSQSRAVAARREGDSVVVTLQDGREVEGSHVLMMPLDSNARAKMQGQRFGFVKVFCSPSGVVIGGVVVAPGGSELIHALALAVRRRLTVDHVAQAFTVYPSLSGSIAEAARRLHMDRPADCAL